MPSQGYRIGRDPTWKTFPLNGMTENINAFTNALIQQISEKESVPLNISDVTNFNLFPLLEKGDFDGVLTTLSPNVENKEKYQFSDPYLLLGPVLIVKADSPADSLEELKGKIVGVYAFDDSVLVVQKDPSLLIQTYENMPSVLDNLVAGMLDGVVMPTLEAHLLVPGRYEGKLRIATAPLTNQGIRLVVLKENNHSLIALFNRGLKKLKRSGAYLHLRANFIF